MLTRSTPIFLRGDPRWIGLDWKGGSRCGHGYFSSQLLYVLYLCTFNYIGKYCLIGDSEVSRYVVIEVVNRRCQQDAFIPHFLPESPCNFGRHFGLAAPHRQA